MTTLKIFDNVLYSMLNNGEMLEIYYSFPESSTMRLIKKIATGIFSSYFNTFFFSTEKEKKNNFVIYMDGSAYCPLWHYTELAY